MMGRLKRDQGQMFYSFCLEEAVPGDHLPRPPRLAQPVAGPREVPCVRLR